MANDYLHGVEVDIVTNPQSPITLVKGSVIGLVSVSDDADLATFPLEQTVLVTSDTVVAQAGTGLLKTALEEIYRQAKGAMVLVHRVAEGMGDAETAVNLIGSVAVDGSRKGLEAMMSAKGDTGYKPKLIVCPYFSHLDTVGAAMSTVATKLKAIPIIDGVSADLAELITQRSLYSKAIVVAPTVNTTVQDVPASAVAAGHIVRVDSDEGYHNSPSNRNLLGVIGTNPTIDHEPGETTSLSNQYSENKLCTFIRTDSGYVFWGNQLADGTLIPHHRIDMIVAETILLAQQQYADRNVTMPFVDFILQRLDNFLGGLVNNGIIKAGKSWLDESLNNDESIANRQVFFDYELVYHPIAERTTYRQHSRVATSGEVFNAEEG